MFYCLSYLLKLLDISKRHLCILYKHCPAAFNTGNDVATIAFCTPWSAKVKALQIISWAARLNFMEDRLKAYDNLLDLDVDEVANMEYMCQPDPPA